MHFTFEEFTRSRIAQERGISNDLPSGLTTSARWTLAGMERIRCALGGYPIPLNSGYRCPEVNALAGGVENSQHPKAEAVDFICPAFGSPEKIVAHLETLMGVLGIDQLILEKGWVHVSFTPEPRYQLISAI